MNREKEIKNEQKFKFRKLKFEQKVMLSRKFYPKEIMEYDDLVLELKSLMILGGNNKRIKIIQERLKKLDKEGWGFED